MALTHNAMEVTLGAGSPRRAYGYYTVPGLTTASGESQIRWPAATAAAITGAGSQSGWLITMKNTNSEGTAGDLAGLYLKSVAGVLHWFLRDAAAGDTDLGTSHTASDTWYHVEVILRPAGTEIQINNNVLGTVAAATGTVNAVHWGQNGPDGEANTVFYFRTARRGGTGSDITWFQDGTLGDFDGNVQNGGTLAVVSAPGVNPSIVIDSVAQTCGGRWGFNFTASDLDPAYRYYFDSARSDSVLAGDAFAWSSTFFNQGGLTFPGSTTFSDCADLPNDQTEVDSGGANYWGYLRLNIYHDVNGFLGLEEPVQSFNFYDWDGDSWELGVIVPPYVSGDAGPLILGAQWRFFVTDLRSEGLTLLDHWATDRTVTAALNAPWSASGVVPSDSPEINILAQVWGSSGFLTTTFHPFLNEGTRLLYGFRREENPGDPPWTCRFGGILLQTSDNGESDPAMTTYTAYDPWQFLYSLPCLIPPIAELKTGQSTSSFAESFPGPLGINFVARPGSLIALSLLARLETWAANLGLYGALPGVTHIDMPLSFMGVALPGSGLWTGTIEETEAIPSTVGDIPFNIPQGTSVGEALDMLCATGTMDIVLRPVYDPVNRPGITSEISIYSRAGQDRPGAPMAWDKPGRSLVGISHETDGTQRANTVRLMYGPGGPPILSLQSDANSRDVYWGYWDQQFYPDGKNELQVRRMAQHILAEHKNGLETIQVTPASERSASPLLEYEPGDRVPVFASANLRKALEGEAFRILEIPINISDNGVESVQTMTVIYDGVMGETSPFATPLTQNTNTSIATALAYRRRVRTNYGFGPP